MRYTPWLLMAAILSGCSTTAADLAKQRAEADRVREEAHAAQRARETQRKQAQLEQIPAWALETPTADPQGIQAVGIAQANRYALALQKARLQAQFALAKTLNQEISGSERAYQRDSGVGPSVDRYTALIDKLVSQVRLQGEEVLRQEVRAIDGQYHAFVLLRLPFEEFNRVLQLQQQHASSHQEAQAFADLERRLRERRRQLMEEASGR